MNADLNAVIAEPAVSHTMQNRAATQMEPGVWDKRYGVDQFVYGAAPNVHIKRTAEQYLTQPCHVVELACGEGRNVAFLAAVGHGPQYSIDAGEYRTWLVQYRSCYGLPVVAVADNSLARRGVSPRAQAGHHVTAVDFSQAGLDKTMQLTRQLAGPEAAARVTPVLADILTWRPGQGKEQGADGETAGAAGDQVEQVDAVVLSFCHVPAASRAAFMQSVREMLKPGGWLDIHAMLPPEGLVLLAHAMWSACRLASRWGV